MIAEPQPASRRARIHVLMYHSISNDPGPTCISPELFASQMSALHHCGYHIATLGDLLEAQAGRGRLPSRCAVITFDDAFADFRSAAAPILSARDYTATVFAPTAYIGKDASWRGAGKSGSRLLTWSEMRELLGAGFEFGSHARRHLDLTTLAPDQLRAELAESRSQLESELGAPTRFFAAPYGRINPAVRREISERYDLAVGTRLDTSTQQSDVFNLPRLEMHYFRDARLWRAFLAGRADSYFSLRQFARAVRSAAATMGL